jgi:demethylmenaquinone methyltransferase / 2-methoxy-6-polyprenyl-1,4-benzoquinol methylase
MHKNPQQYPIHDYYLRIYKRYDLINRLFTFGMDRSWRHEAVEKCLATDPKKVLDLCCGTGDLALEISRISKGKVTLTGYDFNEKMLEMAALKSQQQNLTNLDFIRGNVASMPFSNDEFDCITIGFGFRNLVFENPDAENHLSEMARVLKKAGELIIVESSIPPNNLMRLFYSIYVKLILVPLGGLISGDWKAYRYLALSSANFYNPAQVENILLRKGFVVEFYKSYFFGSVNLVVARKN